MFQFWAGIIIIAIAAALGWWGTQMATDGWSKWQHSQQVSESTSPITPKATSLQSTQLAPPNSNEKQKNATDETKEKTSSPELPNLEKLFRSDFSNLLRSYTHRSIGIEDKNGSKSTVKIGEQMYLDFPGKSKFLGYFIPMSPDSYGVCTFMAGEYMKTIRGFESKASVIGGNVAEFSSTHQEELKFTERIYIYHEDSFTHQQLADLERLYQSKGLSVVFRGPAYLMLKWKSKDDSH